MPKKWAKVEIVCSSPIRPSNPVVTGTPDSLQPNEIVTLKMKAVVNYVPQGIWSDLQRTKSVGLTIEFSVKTYLKKNKCAFYLLPCSTKVIPVFVTVSFDSQGIC